MNKTIINTLTVSRIIFGAIFGYVVIFLDSNITCLFIIFVLVALSDYFDGKLARKYALNTKNGAKLDVISDFLFIILSTISLVYIGLIQFWFIIIIILKLIEFFITSDNEFYYERLGHVVALMFYALPMVAILINSKNINLILCIFITICAVVSSGLRIKEVKFK